MPFDWFTIVAQIINFSILLWLLRRYLYRPILDGLDAREMRLKNVLDEANTKNADAEKRQLTYQQKEAAFEQLRSSILEQTNTEASEQRIKLIDSAQADADEILRKRLEALQSVLLNMQHEVLSKNIEEVYATVRKILDELAGVELEQVIVDKFLSQLNALKGKQRKALLDAMQGNSNIVVRSAFALTDEYKSEIEHTLTAVLGKPKQASVTLNFIRVPKLLAGLELSVGAWKLAWSIDYHLKVLQERVSEMIRLATLKQDEKPEAEGEKSKVSYE